MNTANDEQVAGNHYKSAVQHWDYAAWFFGTGYFKGQITKYIYRWRKKGGVQDLEKAAHFLRKLIELGDKPSPVSVEDFIAVNEIPTQEAEILRIITIGGAPLKSAEEKLAALIAAEPTRSYVDQ